MGAQCHHSVCARRLREKAEHSAQRASESRGGRALTRKYIARLEHLAGHVLRLAAQSGR